MKKSEISRLSSHSRYLQESALNDHFTNIGQVLAQEVPAAEVNPEFYLSHTDKAFCLKTPSLDVVINLLRNIDEKKATGLDMIQVSC